MTGSKECPAIVRLFAISSADVNITNFAVACGSQPGSYTYTLSANNPGSQPFSATSATFNSPGGPITGVTTSPAVPAVTILPFPSPAVTITGTFNYTGSVPALVYVTIAGNQVGNVNLPSSDTEVDSLKQCLCNLCDKVKWLPSTPKVALVGNNINITQVINTYGYGTVIGVKAEIIAFERYVGDSCMSCNKDWNQWGNFTSGIFAGVAGVFGNAVTPVSGNTHHTMYWSSGSAGFPAISTFSMNISTPPLSNLSCCCEKLAVTIRYTYTYKPQGGDCIICTQAPRRYIIQKGNCPKTTPVK